MTEYTNLLRMLKTYEDGYGLYQDATTAIEELMAQVKDKDYLIQQQSDEIERLRRDVKKQQEKMIELAKRLPHWVSVEERLPDRYDAYAVGWRYPSGCFYWGKVLFYDGKWQVDEEIPTPDYWMPIEPPQEV